MAKCRDNRRRKKRARKRMYLYQKARLERLIGATGYTGSVPFGLLDEQQSERFRDLLLGAI